MEKDNSKIIKGTFTVRNDIYCPNCRLKHIDRDDWSKRLHKKHLCEGCGNIWQPYDEYTFGI